MQRSHKIVFQVLNRRVHYFVCRTAADSRRLQLYGCLATFIAHLHCRIHHLLLLYPFVLRRDGYWRKAFFDKHLIELHLLFVGFESVRVDKFILYIPVVRPELVEHILDVIPETAVFGRQIVTIKVNPEKHLFVHLFQHFLRAFRKCVALFGRKVKTCEKITAYHVDKHDNGYHGRYAQQILASYISRIHFHLSFLLYRFHLRDCRTIRVSIKNSAITERKYTTSRVSTTPRDIDS